MIVLWVHHLILAEILISEEPKNAWVERMLEFVQKLCRMVFPPVPRHLWWKLALSHLVWEIPNVFMCNLPDKKLRHFHVPGYQLAWLVGIIVNHSVEFTKKFGSSFHIRIIRVRLPSCHTFLNSSIFFWILYSGLRLISKHSEIFILEIVTCIPSRTACCFQIMVLLSTQTVPNFSHRQCLTFHTDSA